MVAIVVAAIIVLAVLIINLVLNLSIVENLILCWILTTIYAIFALLTTGDIILSPVRTEIKEVEKIVYIDRPVVKEVQVPIQIPVKNKTIEFVEVEKPAQTIYIERPKRTIIIPKYNYIASSQTKRYHMRTCRLGKLIKRKFKISNNSQVFFIRKNYKACKVCIKK